MEIEATLKQEIIELVRLSATEGVGDAGFSYSWIIIKSIDKSTKYISQLFISIIVLMGF